MGNKIKNNRKPYVIKNGKRFSRFYLVNPKHLHISIDSLAEQLIGIREIKELYINDSNETDAFEVIVRFDNKNAPSDMQKYITKRLSVNYGEFAYSRNKK